MPTIDVLTERMEPASPDASAGDIFARLNPPRGSVFTFSLPVAGGARFDAQH